jgi:hypothetical protein
LEHEVIDVQMLFDKVAARLKNGRGIAVPQIQMSNWPGLFDKSASESDVEVAWTELDNACLLNCLHHQHGPSLTAEQEGMVIELIAWASDTLANWHSQNDPTGQKLRIIFAVAMSLRISAGKFLQLSNARSSNSDLRNKLSQYLLDSSLVVTAFPTSRPEETGFITKVQEADRLGDWAALERDAGQILDHINAAWVSAIAQFLAEIAPDELLKALLSARSIFKSYALLSQLPMAKAIGLTSISASNHTRFALLYSLSKGIARIDTNLSDSDQSGLACIWVAMAEDVTEWPKWMAAFNTYPVRFPLLQKSLGRALATMSHSAMSAYIDAVSLGSGLSCRSVMAECFRSFRSIAPVEQRLQLWQLAFDRWSNWNFGEDDEGASLGIRTSALDFAVIAHVVEGMTDEQCLAELSSLAAQAIEIETEWHRDRSHLRTAHNRLISRLYFIETGNCKPNVDDDWLDNKMRIPEAARSSRFHNTRVGMDEIRLI